MFMDALSSVQFQDVTRQRLQAVKDAIHVLDEHANTLAERLVQSNAAHFRFTPLARRLEQMQAGGRAGDDRATPDLPSASAGKAPKVELF
jgi:methyl-accepting chemotaxis protein